MGNFLINTYGLKSIDACALIAFYGNLCFSQVVNPQKTVRMEIMKKHIGQFKMACHYRWDMPYQKKKM